MNDCVPPTLSLKQRLDTQQVLREAELTVGTTLAREVQAKFHDVRRAELQHDKWKEWRMATEEARKCSNDLDGALAERHSKNTTCCRAAETTTTDDDEDDAPSVGGSLGFPQPPPCYGAVDCALGSRAGWWWLHVRLTRIPPASHHWRQRGQRWHQ